MEVYLLLSLFLALLGLFYPVLFPLVSLSTGEFKPRGLYVDENALLVAALASGKLLPSVDSMQLVNITKDGKPDEETFCGRMHSHGSTSCRRVFMPSVSTRKTTVTELLIDRRDVKTLSNDVVVISITYDDTAAGCSTNAFDLVEKLAVDLMFNSKWLSKRVLFLLVPIKCMSTISESEHGDLCLYENGKTSSIRYSYLLDTYLSNYFDDNYLKYQVSMLDSNRSYVNPQYSKHFAISESYSNADQCEEGSENKNEDWKVRYPTLMQKGILREAYILDLTGLSDVHFNRLDKNMDEENAYQQRQRQKSKNKLLMQLRMSGANGMLPNMDLVSAPLALFPFILVLQSDVRALQLDQLAKDKDNLSLVLYRHIRSVFMSSAAGQKYWEKVSSFLQFSSSLLRGPDGVHAHFLKHNVDSITLQPYVLYSGSKKVSASMIRYMLMQLVRLSSQLYEELHHSHWFYLLMGSSTFVGLSEFVIPIALTTISMLCVYLHVSNFASLRALGSQMELFIIDQMPILCYILLIMPYVHLFYKIEGFGAYREAIYMASLSLVGCVCYCGSLIHVYYQEKRVSQVRVAKQKKKEQEEENDDDATASYNNPTEQEEMASYLVILLVVQIVKDMWVGAQHATLGYVVTAVTLPLLWVLVYPWLRILSISKKREEGENNAIDEVKLQFSNNLCKYSGLCVTTVCSPVFIMATSLCWDKQVYVDTMQDYITFQSYTLPFVLLSASLLGIASFRSVLRISTLNTMN